MMDELFIILPRIGVICGLISLLGLIVFLFQIFLNASGWHVKLNLGIMCVAATIGLMTTAIGSVMLVFFT